MKNSDSIMKMTSLLILGLIVGFVIGKTDMGFLADTKEPAKQQVANNQQTAQTTPSATPTFDKNTKVIGAENAPVTIVEYSDFQCPLCKRYIDQTYPALKTKYVDTGKVKYIFKQLPLSSIHPNAEKAAVASECALEQNKFWEMHDELFATQGKWSGQQDPSAEFKTLAGTLGLNQSQFDQCLDSDKYAQTVAAEYQEGRKNGITGTPSFFINGTKTVGAKATAAFETIIEAELAK